MGGDGARATGGLRLDGVGRRYGMRGPWVLRDVTLDLPPASLVRVAGANGSGKSTLLRVAAGVDRPSAGRIAAAPAPRRTAYVPERFPAGLPFPVLRYLVHLGTIRGLSAAAARERALHWLERFGIAGHARTPMDELSKGTCQKVAVSQALLADPGLLVLDEAWTGLDQPARDVLDAAVRERVAAGATVLFVDHDPHRLAGDTTAVYAVASGTLTRARAGAAGAGPTVVIEASAAGGPHGAPEPGAAGLPSGARITRSGAGGVRVAVPAGESDGALRALLAAEPGWHIESVRTERAPAAAEVAAPPVPAPSPAPSRVPAPAPGSALSPGPTPAAAEVAAPGPVPVPSPVTAVAAAAPVPVLPAPVPVADVPVADVRRGRTAAALFRYQTELLLRSQRWLPPLVFYGAVMAIGVAGGEPLLGSLGYAAALLLPVAAWMVRAVLGAEPGAARACVASAAGAERAQRWALSAAAAASGALALGGTLVVTAVCTPHTDDRSAAVPIAAAALAGAMAAAVSVLLGTAVGTLTNSALLPGGGWSVPTTAVAAGTVLLLSGSPAQAAVTGLVTASRTGTVHYPLLPLLVSATATVLIVRLTPRRHP